MVVMFELSKCLVLPLVFAIWPMGAGCRISAQTATNGDANPVRTSIRIATFNVSLNRKTAGALSRELADGKSVQAKKIAEVMQRVRPDLILLNEFDYDETGRALQLFREKYLAVPQNGQAPIDFPCSFAGPVNTGVDSGLDLNGNGKTGEPDDAWGFGNFPGQYGMAVLSVFPIDTDHIRTFGNFAWQAMPDAMCPVDPATGARWYAEETWNRLRLSSKSHWDVPVRISGTTIHFLCAHPTPPVFDGAEDRNGCRNHDEIRLWADYIGGRADYLVDDAGMAGGLDEKALFVIAGDMNADPIDGDSRENAARLLTEHPRINHLCTPASPGAVEAAQKSGKANERHQADPQFDTGDFRDDSVGNVRVDYCLPSQGLEITGCGVFWPAAQEDGHELNDASDHHLVWIDVVVAPH
jgi:hypothetical protein